MFSLWRLFLESRCPITLTGRLLSKYPAQFSFSFPIYGGFALLRPSTLFLKISSLCWPLHERNFVISCVWKHLHAHFPSMFGRHWAVASSVAVEKPMPVCSPVFHTWPVQSLETFSFFLFVVFWNFIMIRLCGMVLFFFFSINWVWHLVTPILQCREISWIISLKMIFLTSFFYFWTSIALSGLLICCVFPSPLFSLSFVCFALFLSVFRFCQLYFLILLLNLFLLSYI